MEASPPSPFEFSGDKDKDKEGKDKKRSSPLRIPLPASEVHANEPKKNERGILSWFEKKESVAEPKAEAPAEPTIEAPKEKPAPPAELTDVHDELWSDFHHTEAAATEPSAAERTEGAEVTAETPHTPELTMPTPVGGQETSQPFETMMQAADTDGELVRAHEALAAHDAPVHHGWDESHTVHLNASDAESAKLWQEFNDAPKAAEVPDWHPEAAPLTAHEQFDDMVQRADMGSEFVAAASKVEEPAEPPAAPPQARALGSFNSLSGAGGAEATPDTGPVRSPFPVSERQPAQAQSYEPPQWHPAPPRYGRPRGGSFAGSAVEAGLLGGAMAHTAAAAAEGGLLAGAAAGAVAGGVAGHMAGERAGRRAAQQEMQQETDQRDRQITQLTNEQRLAGEHMDRLAHDNQQLAKEQAAERPAAVAAPVPPVAERLHDTQDTKVVHSEWVDMVVDKHTGKLVEGPGVNQFGEEFRAEQRAEAAPPDDPLATALAAAQAAAQSAVTVSDSYAQEHGQSISGGPLLPSGQADLAHELGAGAGADPQRRLSEPDHAALSALANPWVWVGFGVIVLAFFAAAFL